MSGGDLVVAGVVVLLVALAVATLLNNRRKGCNSCGCKCCSCKGCSGYSDKEECKECDGKNRE